MNARILKFARIPLLIGAAALFGGCNKETPPAPPAPPTQSAVPVTPVTPAAQEKPAIVSAEKNSFAQVTSNLDKGGNLYLYLSTEQALGGLSKSIATLSNVFSQLPLGPDMGSGTLARIFQVVDGLVKDSGVEQISGVGASSIAREPGFYYNKFIVHHYAGQGEGLMWTAFGKEAHPLKELDLLPENTAWAAYGDLDVPLAWKTVLGELRKLHLPEVDNALDSMPENFKDAAGMDLDEALGSLGGGYGVIFTLDESNQVSVPIGDKPLLIPDPGLAIFFKVKNDAIFNRVEQVSTNIPGVTEKDLDGLKTLSMSLGPLLSAMDLHISLSPTLAHSGEYLILTSSDKLLQDIVAVQTGKKSGFKSTAEFKKLSQGIPNNGNNFTLVSAKFGKTFGQVMQGVASAQVGPGGAASKSLQDMMATNAAGFSYSVSANGPEGWTGYGNGSKSMASAAVVLPAAFAGGMLAAIAVPNFTKARTTAQENACINNLRIIDGAKGQWALENHKQNSDTPTVQDLTPYVGRGPAGEFPVCPEGGKYIIGTIGEKPRCTIPGHVLP